MIETLKTENEGAGGPSALSAGLEHMVREAHIFNVGTCEDCGLTMYQLGKLVDISTKYEREACAKLCEDIQAKTDKWGPMAGYCAEQIRMRSNAKSEPTAPLLAQVGSTDGLGIAPGKEAE